jgi:hypothetical protein
MSTRLERPELTGHDWPHRYVRGRRPRVSWRSIGNARSGHIGSIGRLGRRDFAYADATEGASRTQS